MRLGHGSLIGWWWPGAGSATPLQAMLGSLPPCPGTEAGIGLALLGLVLVLLGSLWHLRRQLQTARRTLQAYEVLDRLVA